MVDQNKELIENVKSLSVDTEKLNLAVGDLDIKVLKEEEVVKNLTAEVNNVKLTQKEEQNMLETLSQELSKSHTNLISFISSMHG